MPDSERSRNGANPPSDESETPFYISLTGPRHRPRKTLKYGETFAVIDSHGDIGAIGGGADGLFCSDTRFLSLLELVVNGLRPILLGSHVRDDNLHMHADLTTPDIYRDGVLVLPKDCLHIGRTTLLTAGMLRQRISVRNYSEARIDVMLAVSFGHDFADIFEVRGLRRALRGTREAEVSAPGMVLERYVGLDGVERVASLSFEPQPAVQTQTSASFQCGVGPGGRFTLQITAACDERERGASFYSALRRTARERRVLLASIPTVETSNVALNEVLDRSRADFAMLVTQTEQGPYPYAGIPWYSTTFGRDGLIAAMQMLWLDPSVARGVLLRLAAMQADATDPKRDMEPGKILHEARDGEMARLGEVPFHRYYGSVDATPLFVVLGAMYVERSGDDAFARQIWPHVERALGWIDGPGDADGDGFVEYLRGAQSGLANQGWKDSVDSVFHDNGTLADGAIALIEVQAYVFAAKSGAACLARRLGLVERAQALKLEAKALKNAVEDRFWCDRLGTYVMALDGAKRPCMVASSNAGHVLFGGLCTAERARLVGTKLMTPDFFSGWGIRTIGVEAPRYNPMSYHNGSIWPHDNAMIAVGMAKYGMKDAALRIFDGLFRSATHMEHRRLPELFCGFPRRAGRGPTLYPVACAPQAWSSGSLFMTLQALLGVEFDATAGALCLRNPVLPDAADEIVVRGLTVGAAEIDFAVRRHGSTASLQVLRARGPVSANIVLDAQQTERVKR